MHFDQGLCRNEPIVIELDGRKDEGAFETQLAEALNRVSTGWWKGPLIVVLRHLREAWFLEEPMPWLVYLSERATDCEVCLENCHPDLVRLFEAPTYRRHFNIITVSTSPPEVPRNSRQPTPAL